MLKEAPNNNDSMCVAKYVLNKVPNRNDATGTPNNVHLTTMGAKQFSMAAVYIHSHHIGKLTYQR